MPAARRRFDELSVSQQKRYIGAWRSGKANGTKHSGSEAQLRAGVRRWYESPQRKPGFSQKALGHGQRAQEPAERQRRAIRTATTRERRAAARAVARGDATDAQEKLFDRWWQSRTFPNWIPKNRAEMRADTAAALSAIDIPPSRWKSGVFRYEPDGVKVRMIVQGTTWNARPREVVLADYDSVRDVLKWLRRSTSGIDVETRNIES